MRISFTYDHRLRKTWYPVCSALIKPQIDRLVVGWVTTSESRLLYVFAFAEEDFSITGWKSGIEGGAESEKTREKKAREAGANAGEAAGEGMRRLQKVHELIHTEQKI